MKNIKFVPVLFLAFLTACAESATNTSVYSTANAGYHSKPDFVSTDQNVAPMSERAGSGSGSGGDGIEKLVVQQVSLTQAEQTQTAPIVVERKIIRNADLQLEADAPEEAQAKITQIAESKSGFVVESMQSSSDAKTTKRDTVTMTVRVPSALRAVMTNEPGSSGPATHWSQPVPVVTGMQSAGRSGSSPRT